jgi:4-hydroxythreonine-4-phosphate dehydrogenase (EC 1.1.1.262)
MMIIEKNLSYLEVKKIVNHFIKLLGINKEVNLIKDTLDFDEEKINVVNVVDIDLNDFEFGKVSKLCGDAAYKYVETAIKWALDGKIKAVVTAPLNKEALHLAGYNYDGHTEIFAQLTNTKKYAMMLWSEKLKVIHVSTHVSLREACNRVKKIEYMTL